MPQTGLRGPFSINKAIIDSAVTSNPGVFVLGYVEIGGDFIPKYVSRSDADTKQSLKEWVNSRYSKFKFDCYDTAELAFTQECRLYHDWKEQLDNHEHPTKLDKKWNCPYCKSSTNSKK